VLLFVRVTRGVFRLLQVLNKTSAAGQWLMLVDLTDLKPFTRYQLSVDCIPMVDGKILGFWSEAVSQQFTTREDGSLY